MTLAVYYIHIMLVMHWLISIRKNKKLYILPTSESHWVTFSCFRKNAYSTVEIFIDVAILFVSVRSKLTWIEQRLRPLLKWSWSPKVKATWGETLISLHLKLNHICIGAFSVWGEIFIAEGFFDLEFTGRRHHSKYCQREGKRPFHVPTSNF